MKKFIYIAVAVILATSLMPGINYSAPANITEITIESPEASPEMLLQAEGVIIKRLEAYGLSAFETERYPEKAQIRIRFQEAAPLEAAIPLLTDAGRLEFSAVYTQAEVFSLISRGGQKEAWNRWLPLEEQAKGENAVIGSIAPESIPDFGRFAASREGTQGLPADLRFALGLAPDENGQRELYALQYGLNGKPALTGTAVERSQARFDEAAETASISLAFNEQGSARWAQATRDNLGRPIAIAFDGQVVFAPRVLAEIQSGQAQVTGQFSYEQARLIAALIQGGELPAPFTVKGVKQ